MSIDDKQVEKLIEDFENSPQERIDHHHEMMRLVDKRYYDTMDAVGLEHKEERAARRRESWRMNTFFIIAILYCCAMATWGALTK